jgi:hypothetical protein
LLANALAYFLDLSKDRDIHRSLTDESSASLVEAARRCETFIVLYRSQNLDWVSATSPEERESKQMRGSSVAAPTFEMLKKFFDQNGAKAMVEEFDRAEIEREGLERIRRGESS